MLFIYKKRSFFSANNLLSLSELWNREPTFHSDDPNKLRQKLEEEKYRRQVSLPSGIFIMVHY